MKKEMYKMSSTKIQNTEGKVLNKNIVAIKTMANYYI